MNFIKALDAALDKAEDALEPQALYRLTEILVEEVSVVDKAANKHRFLLVKRDKGDSTVTDPKKLSLTAEAKSALAEPLTAALGGLVNISNALKEAEEAEDGATVLPKDLLASLGEARQELSSIVVASAEKKVGSAVEALVQIAEMSMNLAEEVATSGEVVKENTAKMNQMAELLKALSKSEAGDDDDDGDDADKIAADKAAAEKVEADKAIADKAAADKAAADGDPAPKVDDDAAKAADAKFDKLADMISGLATSVGSLATTVAEQAKASTKPSDEKSELQKQLDAMKEENKVTRQKLAKSIAEPPSRSTSDGGGGGDDKVTVLFPQDYNS